MDLYTVLMDAFSIDNKSIQELIEISSLIDNEKSNNGFLCGETNEVSVIASTIVALINERSTNDIGQKLDDKIKDLIVKKNFEAVVSNDGEKLYEQLKLKDSPGTYKVRRIITGYKFDIVASNGEVLATSEVYTTMDSCINGIQSVKKNACAMTEDQTIDDYQVIRNPKYEVYCDKKGELRFRLKSMNGQILVVSGEYKNREECLAAIEKIKKSVHSNDVEKD